MLRLSVALSITVIALVLPQVQAAEPVPPANPFHDPLDTPAEALAGALLPTKQPMLEVAKAGDRLVAVGLRGLILLSDDSGKTWRQATVPAQSDLTSVYFPTPKKGWAVGHEGVILASDDGGQTWTKQLDGRVTQTSLSAYYKQRVDAGEAAMQPFLDEVALNTQAGPTLPYLSVYFDDESSGYAVGSFGMILKTDDGGKTWIPWLDHIDNPGFLNLNALRKLGSDLYIAGEKGSVYHFDRKQQRFVSISTTYMGSFFGITGDKDFLLAFGLAGNIFRSSDGGTTWNAVVSGVGTALTAGSIATDETTLLLATENGQLIASNDQGRSFKLIPAEAPMLYSAMTALDGHRFIFAGYQGLSEQTFNSENSSAAAHN